MGAAPAVYRADDATYVADTCGPLRAAAARGAVALSARVHGSYPGTPLPDDVVPEVATVGVWDAPTAQDWGLDWHRNEGIELTFLERGMVGFAVDGHDDVLLRQGALTITRPWQRHRVGDPTVAASRLAWLVLDVDVRRPDQAWSWPSWLLLADDDVTRLETLLRHQEQPVWRATPALARAFAELVEPGDVIVSEGTRIALGVNALLVALLELLVAEDPVLDPSLSSSERTVELFLADLRRRAGEPWTPASMAAECGLGRSRFTELCRSLVNASPGEYLTACRVDLARELLADPRRRVTDVALDSGFATSQHFATVFRAHTGLTPTDHRRRLGG